MATKEAHAFLVSRTVPRFDAAVVEEASIDGLDPEFVDAYIAACHESSTALRRFDREERSFVPACWPAALAPFLLNGLVAATDLTARQVRYALGKLRDRNEVQIRSGGRGLRTTYELRAP